MDAKGEALLVLTPAQKQSMITRLRARSIPIVEVRYAPNTELILLSL